MERPPELRVSRRHLFKMGAAIAFGALSANKILEDAGMDPLPGKAFASINDFSIDSYDPIKVAQTFLNASAPILMALYADFFPSFLKTRRRDAVSAIREATSTLESTFPPAGHPNRHRLDALPAAVSAHLLSRHLSPGREELCEVISKRLQDPRREVKEIVLQNLITASYPDYDTVARFSVDQTVLDSLCSIIDEAASSAKLISPLCLSLEFLLRLEALSAARGANSQALRSVEMLIEGITSSKVPHFQYATRLVDVHRRTYPTASAYDHNSLPPQRSEALLGWETLYGSRFITFDYLETIALIHARMLFSIWTTAIGKDSSTDQIMTVTEAQVALPKALGFVKYHKIRSLLPRTGDLARLNLPMEEREFEKFLEGNLDELLADQGVSGIDLSTAKPSVDEQFLATRVPFSQHKEGGLLNKLWSFPNPAVRDSFRQSISVGTEFVKTAAAAYTVFSFLEAAPWYVIPYLYGRLPRCFNPSESDTASVKEAALRKCDEVDDLIGSELDREDEELPPILPPRDD